MTNLELARAHGLIVMHLIEDGKFHRVPTVDHPYKTNGAYCVVHGCITVQNWATEVEASFYKENATAKNNVEQRKVIQEANESKLELQMKASRKAGYILQNCEMLEHDYLARKGFEKLKWNVYENKIVIPMRVDKNLCGVQMIDQAGVKKFLYGQRCDLATFQMGNKGLNILVEGFATGLTAQKMLMKANVSSKIYVCFSANNMLKISKTLPKGLVIADNDTSGTGQRIAEATGWPYWISKTAGQDLNDYSATVSDFRLTQELKKLFIK